MRFLVGPYRYKLRIASEPICHEGNEATATISENDRMISVSPDCPPRNRLAAVAHELLHGWVYASGEPSDLEGWCDLAATMAVALLNDLRCQGGEEAIMGLEPGECLSATTARAIPGSNYQCAKCRGTIAGGVCGPSETPGILQLAIYCDHCEHVQRWNETAGASGFPSGLKIGLPRFERGEAVNRFLADHSSFA